MLVPYVFVFSPSLLLVTPSFEFGELVTTIVRMLAAIWMLATALGAADPIVGRLGTGQRVIRLVIGMGAMLPVAAVWIPAVFLTMLVGLLSNRISQSIMFRNP